jgi:NAD(P)H-hydrate epimerase
MRPEEIDGTLIARLMPPRRRTSRKGENGVVLVVGGSKLYHGAPTLAALSALRSGVDLVFVAVPEPIAAPVRSISPALIVFPLPDSKLTRGAADRLLKWLPRVDVAILGPGLGRQRTDGLRHLIQELKLRGVRLLLDADALQPEVVEVAAHHPTVITPHAGEFRRVFGVEPGPDLEARVQLVGRQAEEKGLVILLKGPVDVVSDGANVYVNRTGTPAMTVGGTGDVLSGLVGGLMAYGLPPLEAAIAGAYINGLAGERAAERLGLHLTPLDLVEAIPYVMKQFDRVID